MNTGGNAGLRAAYLDTIIEFADPDGVRWRLRSRAAGESGADVVPSFLGYDFEAWVITAWNPESVPVPAEQNATAQRELLADVEAAGLIALPAVGMSRDRSWAEESVLVVGATREWVLGIAKKYKQNAVFLWTPDSLVVVCVLIPGEASSSWVCERS